MHARVHIDPLTSFDPFETADDGIRFVAEFRGRAEEGARVKRSIRSGTNGCLKVENDYPGGEINRL